MLVVTSDYTTKLFHQYESHRITFVDLDYVDTADDNICFLLDDITPMNVDKISNTLTIKRDLIDFIEKKPNKRFIVLSDTPEDYKSMENVIKAVSIFDEKRVIHHRIFNDENTFNIFLNLHDLSREHWYNHFQKHLIGDKTNQFDLVVDFSPFTKFNRLNTHQLYDAQKNDLKNFIRYDETLKVSFLDLRLNLREVFEPPVEVVRHIITSCLKDYRIHYVMDSISSDLDLSLLSDAHKVYISQYEKIPTHLVMSLERMYQHEYF